MIFVFIIASALAAVLVANQAIRSSRTDPIPKALEPQAGPGAEAFAAEADKTTVLEATIEELKEQLRCSDMRGRRAEEAWMRAFSQQEAKYEAALAQCRVAYQKRHEHEVGQLRAKDFEWQRKHEEATLRCQQAEQALAEEKKRGARPGRSQVKSGGVRKHDHVRPRNKPTANAQAAVVNVWWQGKYASFEAQARQAVQDRDAQIALIVTQARQALANKDAEMVQLGMMAQQHGVGGSANMVPVEKVEEETLRIKQAHIEELLVVKTECQSQIELARSEWQKMREEREALSAQLAQQREELASKNRLVDQLRQLNNNNDTMDREEKDASKASEAIAALTQENQTLRKQLDSTQARMKTRSQQHGTSISTNMVPAEKLAEKLAEGVAAEVAKLKQTHSEELLATTAEWQQQMEVARAQWEQMVAEGQALSSQLAQQREDLEARDRLLDQLRQLNAQQNMDAEIQKRTVMELEAKIAELHEQLNHQAIQEQVDNLIQEVRITSVPLGASAGPIADDEPANWDEMRERLREAEEAMGEMCDVLAKAEQDRDRNEEWAVYYHKLLIEHGIPSDDEGEDDDTRPREVKETEEEKALRAATDTIISGMSSVGIKDWGSA
ncbi:hypothetical protein N7535_001507 [Penicillium sp. DV-2018c]|nr:hypothetical protein N7461_005248 [Penicillium sp. DV-2018c]KAJ5582887.1 hypothetical protein N7535_001507 [Penicillium sp. DV-2018c]